VNDFQWLRVVRRTYAVFLLLIIINIGLIASSETMRNVLGQVDGRGWTDLAVRIIPSVILLGFYSWFLARGFRSVLVATMATALHSTIFSLLGLAAMLPWLGLFAAALTPISPIYIGAILWFSNGYYAACVVALLFTGVNLSLGKIALDHRRDSAGFR